MNLERRSLRELRDPSRRFRPRGLETKDMVQHNPDTIMVSRAIGNLELCISGVKPVERTRLSSHGGTQTRLSHARKA